MPLSHSLALCELFSYFGLIIYAFFFFFKLPRFLKMGAVIVCSLTHFCVLLGQRTL